MGSPGQNLYFSGQSKQHASQIKAVWQAICLDDNIKFIGFTDIRTLRVEGTLSPAAQDNLEKIKTSAVEAGQRFCVNPAA